LDEARTRTRCLIRGLSPVPGAWCEMKGERIKVLLAEPVAGKGTPGEVLSGLTIACGEVRSNL